MPFSSRIVAEREPNRLTLAIAAARRSGRSLVDLTVANPTAAELPYEGGRILAALSATAGLVYDPSPLGLRSTRGAIAEQWREVGMSVATEQIVLTASTSEAYALLFKLLCDPGDEVLAPEPSYPLFEDLARLESVRLVPYPVRYDGSWHLDLAGMRSAVSRRTRAVLVVSPNNPTGNYLKHGELTALLGLGLPIICDEVFASFPLREVRHRVRSVLEARAGLVFALDGLSKRAGLPQLKLGWITVGGELARRTEAIERLEIIADTYLSVGTPVQLAAPQLLAVSRVTREAIQRRLTSNLSSLRAALADTTGTVLDVEGGWYATVRLPSTATEEDWVLELLDAGVVVHPGWFYDFPRGPIIVLSLLTPEGSFDAGIDRLRQLL